MDTTVIPYVEKTYQVTLLRNPFIADSVCATVPVHVSLSDLVPEKVRHAVHIEIDGEVFNFDREVILDDSLVSITLLPQDNDTLRIVGAIIVIAIAWELGPGVAGAFGWSSSFAVGFVTAAIATVGMLALNTLIPVVVPEFAGPSGRGLPSLSPTRNRLAPYDVIPAVFGRVRQYPPFAAMPFTSIIGNDQYLHALFALGHGEFQTYTGIKIGDTPIESYEGVNIEILPAASVQFESVNEDGFNAELTQPLPNNGSSYTRRSAPGASMLSVDLVMPRGLIYVSPNGADDNERINLTFDITIRRVSDGQEFIVAAADNEAWTNDWVALTWGTNQVRMMTIDVGFVELTVPMPPEDNSVFELDGHFCISGFTYDPIRRTIKFATPSIDQYDVTVHRYATTQNGMASTYSESSSGSNWQHFVQESRLITLRTHILESVVPSGQTQGDTDVTYAKLRVRASDQLSGTLDQFNLIPLRRYWYWNGSAWVLDGGWELLGFIPVPKPMQYPRSPAWAAVEVLCGDMNIRKVDRATAIDAAAFRTWADWCRTNHFYYDDEIYEAQSVWDLLKRIAAVGRAEIVVRDGVYTVIQDHSQTSPVQLFSIRNYKNFQGSKVFVDPLHGVRIQYRSEAEDYQQTERFVYADGYDASNASKFEVMQLAGITDDSQAWREGRRILGIAVHRPEFFSIEVDFESIVSLRGDTVLLQSDSALIGVSAGRINAVDDSTAGQTTITLDSGVDLELGTTYSLQVRSPNGTSPSIETRQVTLPASGAGISVLVTQEFSLTPQVGDLFIFGETTRETMRCKVLAIEPMNDLAARVHLIPEGAAIYTADTGPIPPYDPLITQPPDFSMVAPSKPRIIAVRSDRYVSPQQPDGSVTLRMQITYQIDSIASYAGLEVQARVRQYDPLDPTVQMSDWRYTGWFRHTEGILFVDQIQEGLSYHVQVIARTVPTYIESPYSDIVTHTVGGPNVAPVIVEGLVIQTQLGGVQAIVDITDMNMTDARYVEIQYNTIDERDRGDAQRYFYNIPNITQGMTQVDFFIPLPDGAIRYFWARVVNHFGFAGEWFPAPGVGGADVRVTSVADTRVTSAADTRVLSGSGLLMSGGVPGYAQTDIVYYIMPLRGTAIKNSTGTLGVEAHRVNRDGDEHLSTGTIRLYKEDGTTLAGDGYTWDPITAADILGDTIVYLRDGPGGPVYDSITLADITDGEAGVGGIGFFSRYDRLVWRRDRDLGAWEPDANPVFVDINFYDNGASVARDALRLELNSSTGVITANAEVHSGGDLDAGSITIVINGVSGPTLPYVAGTTCTITATRTISGVPVTCSETFSSIEGGVSGFPTNGLLYDPEFERENLIGNNFHWKVREGTGISFDPTGGADGGTCALFTCNGANNSLVAMDARGNAAANERIIHGAPGQRIYFSIRLNAYLAYVQSGAPTFSWPTSGTFTVRAECYRTDGNPTTNSVCHGHVPVSQHTVLLDRYNTFYGWIDLDSDPLLANFKFLLGPRAILAFGEICVDAVQIYTTPPSSWGLDAGNMFPMASWISSAGAILDKWSRAQLELLTDTVNGSSTMVGPGETGYPAGERVDPFFEQGDVIMRNVADAVGTSTMTSGGFQYNATVWQVDPRKGYRFTAFVRISNQQRTPAGGNADPQLSVTLRSRVTSSSGAFWQNKSGTNVTTPVVMSNTVGKAFDRMMPGQWYMLVLHIHPTGASWTEDQSGMYDPVTGQKLFSVEDFRFASSTVFHAGFVMQALNMAAVNDEFFIRRPRFECIDGAPDLYSLMGVSANRAADNMVNTLGWPTVDTTITADRWFRDGWLVSDYSDQGSFTRITGPLGEQVTAFRAVRNGTTSGWQGVLSLRRAVDPNKSYMVGIWVRRSFTTAGLYIGALASGSTPAVALDNLEGINGSATSNPVFISNASLPTADRWYLFYTIVRNHQNADSASDGISGIYDPTTGTNVVAATQFRFIDADSMFLGLTFGDYATSGLVNGDTTYFAHPMFYQVDDDFPSIETLLNKAKSWGTISAGKFVSESGSGYRLEIEAGHQFPIWGGTGTKNEANAGFYYDRTNQLLLVRGGTVESGLIKTSILEPSVNGAISVRTQSGGTPLYAPVIASWSAHMQDNDLTGDLMTETGFNRESPHTGLIYHPTGGASTRSWRRLQEIQQPFLVEWEFFLANNTGTDATFEYRIEFSYDSGSWSVLNSSTSVTFSLPAGQFLWLPISRWLRPRASSWSTTVELYVSLHNNTNGTSATAADIHIRTGRCRVTVPNIGDLSNESHTTIDT